MEPTQIAEQILQEDRKRVQIESFLKTIASGIPADKIAHFRKHPELNNLHAPTNLIDLLAQSHEEKVARTTQELTTIKKNLEDEQQKIKEIQQVVDSFKTRNFPKTFPSLRLNSVIAGVLLGSTFIMQEFLKGQPLTQQQIEMCIELFKNMIERIQKCYFDNYDNVLDAYADFVFTFAVSFEYPLTARVSWLTSVGDLLKQRISLSLDTLTKIQIMYGRSQLLLSRLQLGGKKIKVLEKGIEILETTPKNADSRIILGILKAELLIQSTRDINEWTKLRAYFDKRGAQLNNEFHFAICTIKWGLTANDTNEEFMAYYTARTLLKKHLANFEKILSYAESNEWWNECKQTIVDFCVRNTYLLEIKEREQFHEYFSPELKKIVMEVVNNIETNQSIEEVDQVDSIQGDNSTEEK